MFKLCKFPAGTREVSYHERRNLEAREANPRANILRAVVLDGALDATVLQEALQRLVLRHEAMRTRFFKEGSGCYVREVFPVADVRVELRDFSAFNVNDEVVKSHIGNLVKTGFGPEDYPLVKLHLLTTAQQPVFIFLVAEVIADAMSVAFLIRELGALYLAAKAGIPAELPALTHQLSDFVASHNAWMQGDDYQASLLKRRDMLHRQIEAEGGVGQLIFARRSNDSYSVSKDFPDSFGIRLFQLAGDMQVSPPTVLTVASAMCIARMRNLPGIFLTSSFSNRHIAGLANMVGHIATTVPSFVSLGGSKASYSARQMHRELFASMAQYGMLPMQEISDAVKKLYPQRPPGTTIKFGKVVIDVSMIDELMLFGMESRLYPMEGGRAEANEFKFVYRVLSTGKVGLQLRGLQETDNDIVAAKIVDHLLQETLDSL